MRQIHPILVTMAEAGAMIGGKSSLEVSDLLAEGLIRPAYIGDQCLVRVDSIHAWVDSLPTKNRWTA